MEITGYLKPGLNKKGKQTLRLSVYYSDTSLQRTNRIWIYPGITIFPKAWSQGKQRLVGNKGEGNYDLYNRRITRILESLDTLSHSNSLTEKVIRENISQLLKGVEERPKENSFDFLKFLLEYFSKKQTQIESTTFSNYISRFKNVLEYVEPSFDRPKDNSFREFEKYLSLIIEQHTLDIRSITDHWIQNLQIHLESKLGHSTSNAIISNLSSCWQEATEQDNWPTPPNPFPKLKHQQSEIKLVLTSPEIDFLKNYHTDSSYQIYRLAIDVFLFCYYAYGMRVGDAVSIKLKNLSNRQCRYRLSKGSYRWNNVFYYGDELQALIQKYSKDKSPNDYLFPFISGINSDLAITDKKIRKELKRQVVTATSRINKALKKQFKDHQWLNSGSFSTHVARHSFAAFSYRKTKDIMLVKKQLNHQRYETTENYLRSLGLLELSGGKMEQQSFFED